MMTCVVNRSTSHIECGKKTKAKGTERASIGDRQHSEDSVPKQQADKLLWRFLFPEATSLK